MQCGGKRTKGFERKSLADRPLISVVTVVYNGQKHLEQSIQSVMNQTYDNIEYVIIDGNSSDGTLDIIKKYEESIDYWQSEPDKGIYDAMNKGISLASGDYIVLLNADDWFDCDLVKNAVNEIRDRKYDVIYGVLRFYNDLDEITKIEGNTTEILPHGMICHPTCLISRELYAEKKYDTNYKSAADYDLINYFYKNGKDFKFSEKIIGNFRCGGMSSSKIGRIESAKIQLKYGYISRFSYILRIVYIKFFL